MQISIYYGFCLTTDEEFKAVLTQKELEEIWAEYRTHEDNTDFPLFLAAMKVCEKYNQVVVVLDDGSTDCIRADIDDNSKVVIGILVNHDSPDQSCVLSIPDLENEENQLLIKFQKQYPAFRAFSENFWVFGTK